MMALAEDVSPALKPGWYKATAKYQQPDLRKALWQLVNTFVPYVLLWYVMYRTIVAGYPYWITLLLAVVGAGLQIRIFIFFHDCCHGSFFASRQANKILGYICGILTLTPYEDWRHAHAIHHATVGDLDRRGTGDVWTMTVREYLDAPWWRRAAYRVVRHPLVTFGIGPVLVFALAHRLPHKGARRHDRLSVYITDAAVVALLLVAHVTIGLKIWAMIYLPILFISVSAGVWLFYVQHQVEDAYWSRHEQWDPMRAALEGSSFYRLPKVLQWFSGNIGYHHVHHVRARIPNYNLQQCHEEIAELRATEPLTILKSLRCMFLDLWDEQRQKLVSFRSLRSLVAAA
jgi:omega-6 fatty acid desaturase (delta-12 desaturase)